jgi:hypothetical protein
MKTSSTLGFFTILFGGFLFGCGGGSDAAVTTDTAADVNACDCLVEMNSTLSGLLTNEANATWTAKQWTEELAKASSPCMSKTRTPQELSAWSQEQTTCETYEEYKSLVGTFRAKMVAAKGAGQEMPQNIRDISEEGAKGLLDQLSKQR